MTGEFDFDARMRAWSAVKLGVPQAEIVSVETQMVGGCDTCEFNTTQVDVVLADGRRFHGENTFGLFLHDIVEYDITDEGVSTGWNGGELFELTEVV